MPIAQGIQLSIEKALIFLQKEQQGDGSFLSFSSPSRKTFQNALQFQSVFSTALIAQNISVVSHASRAQKIQKRAVQFLLNQKSKMWSWNYWLRGGSEAARMPYPDDLDDTFVSLSALQLSDSSLITGDVLAAATQILMVTETQEGGPYRTWLVPSSAEPIWQDVDLVVNANIAYFLKLQQITLSPLEDYFEHALETGAVHSPYYPNTLAILFFLSRVVGKKNHALVHNLVRKQKIHTPLECALAVLARMHAGEKKREVLQEYISTIRKAQQRAGGWRAGALYTGVNPRRDSMYYAGSTALTTSYCVAALQMYDTIQTSQRARTVAGAVQKKSPVHAVVLELVRQRFARLEPNIRKQAVSYTDALLKRDGDQQITLLPYFFSTAFGKKSTPSSTQLVTQLGAASFYGWLAYSVYDDFLDEEGKISALPLANVCLRELTEIFSECGRSLPGFPAFFQRIMDTLEEANTWEVTHCRFRLGMALSDIQLPDFSDRRYLANRSLGHALGSVVICMTEGYSADSQPVRDLMEFYTHFLIARQLNDDAHDWEQDLRRGHINFVGAMVLKKIRKSHPDLKLDSKSIPHLRHIFWHEGVEEVCALIDDHAQMALRLLEGMTMISDRSSLKVLVEKQQESVHITREERKKALEFLAAYKET